MSWRNPVGNLVFFSVTAFAVILSKGTQASAVVGGATVLTNTDFSIDNLSAKWLLQINLLLDLPIDFRDWKDFDYQLRNIHFNQEHAKENWRRVSLIELKSQKWENQKKLFNRASQTHLVQLQVLKMDMFKPTIPEWKWDLSAFWRNTRHCCSCRTPEQPLHYGSAGPAVKVLP